MDNIALRNRQDSDGGRLDDERLRKWRGLVTKPNSGSTMLSERVRTLSGLDWQRSSLKDAQHIGEG